MSSAGWPTDVEQASSLIGAQDPAKRGFGAGCSPTTGKHNRLCAHNVQHHITRNQELNCVKQVPLQLIENGEDFQEGGGRWWCHDGCHGQRCPGGEEGAFLFSCLIALELGLQAQRGQGLHWQLHGS